jgi:hypothetical protein
MGLVLSNGPVLWTAVFLRGALPSLQASPFGLIWRAPLQPEPYRGKNAISARLQASAWPKGK